jgi:hypothetical protein
VDPKQTDEVARTLDEVLGGNPSGLVRLAELEPAGLREIALARGSHLVVSRKAAIAVLTGFQVGSISPEQAQAWASFVSMGFIANRVREPVRPLDIDFEDAWEDAISATVSRLDEIGDLVDGVVDAGEVRNLLELLGEPSEP